MCVEPSLPSQSRSRSRLGTSSNVLVTRPRNNGYGHQIMPFNVNVGVWQGIRYRDVTRASGGPVRQLLFDGFWRDLYSVYGDTTSSSYGILYQGVLCRCQPIGEDHLAIEVDGQRLYACEHDHFLTPTMQTLRLPIQPREWLHRRNDQPNHDNPYIPYQQMRYQIPVERSSLSSMWSIESSITDPRDRPVHISHDRGRRHHVQDGPRALRMMIPAREVIIQNMSESARSQSRGRSYRCHPHHLPSPRHWPRRWKSSSADRHGRRYRSVSRHLGYRY